MSNRKNPYKLSTRGKIIGYDPNLDSDRFSFVSPGDGMAQGITEKTGLVTDGIVGSPPYVVDWEDVFANYMDWGIGDVPHFASQYVFSGFLLKGRAHEKGNMQAMYLELVDRINGMIETGELPAVI
ncbi:MAG: hypothetical protein AAFX53_16880 [Bacteroidota bacterium]